MYAPINQLPQSHALNTAPFSRLTQSFASDKPLTEIPIYGFVDSTQITIIRLGSKQILG